MSAAESLVKVGLGALLGAALTAVVYEAGGKKTATAGTAAATATAHAGRAEDRATRAQDEAAGIAPQPSGEPKGPTEQAYEEANRALVQKIQELNRKLGTLEEQKTDLKGQLEGAQKELSARQPGAKPDRHEFDLDAEDWKKLAESGTIKFRIPCVRPDGWRPPDEQMQKLGLAPQDAPVIQAAYKRSYERMWSEIKPLCGAAVNSLDIAEKIGLSTCIHLVLDLSKDREAAQDAMRQTGEVRAGLRPKPGADAHPVQRLFLNLTGEMAQFEADLTKNYGPEEAHRLVYSSDLCASHSTFGGPGPKKK